MQPYNRAQEVMAPFLRDHPVAYLLAGAGLGKSRVALGATPLGALILAPATGIAMSWPDEVRKWGLLPYHKLWSAEGEAAWTAGEPAYYGLSYEMMDRVSAMPPPPVPGLIYDESHRLKNPRGLRSVGWRKEALYKQFDQRIAMTGTPRPNGLWDMFNQVKHLDGGERLGVSYTAFEEQYFSLRKNEYHAVIGRTPRPGAEEAIHKLIADITLVLRAEDYLDIAPMETTDHFVKLPPDVMKQYKAFKKELVLALPAGTVAAKTAGDLIGKLVQFTSGFMYDADKQAHQVHDVKQRATEELLRTRRALVIAWYHHERDALRERLKLPGLSEQSLADWNARRIRGIVMPPKEMLNMQAGGDCLIWHTLPWSSTLYTQTNARLHRTGQTGQVTCIRIIAENTVDEHVAEVLRRKLDDTDATLTALELLRQ